MADTVVGSVAKKLDSGELGSETPVGVDASHVYYTGTDGKTYTLKQMLDWIDSYIKNVGTVYNSAFLSDVSKDTDLTSSVPSRNIGMFIDYTVTPSSLMA